MDMENTEAKVSWRHLLPHSLLILKDNHASQPQVRQFVMSTETLNLDWVLGLKEGEDDLSCVREGNTECNNILSQQQEDFLQKRNTKTSQENEPPEKRSNLYRHFHRRHHPQMENQMEDQMENQMEDQMENHKNNLQDQETKSSRENQDKVSEQQEREEEGEEERGEEGREEDEQSLQEDKQKHHQNRIKSGVKSPDSAKIYQYLDDAFDDKHVPHLKRSSLAPLMLPSSSSSSVKSSTSTGCLFVEDISLTKVCCFPDGNEKIKREKESDSCESNLVSRFSPDLNQKKNESSENNEKNLQENDMMLPASFLSEKQGIHTDFLCHYHQRKTGRSGEGKQMHPEDSDIIKTRINETSSVMKELSSTHDLHMRQVLDRKEMIKEGTQVDHETKSAAVSDSVSQHQEEEEKRRVEKQQETVQTHLRLLHEDVAFCSSFVPASSCPSFSSSVSSSLDSHGYPEVEGNTKATVIITDESTTFTETKNARTTESRVLSSPSAARVRRKGILRPPTDYTLMMTRKTIRMKMREQELQEKQGQTEEQLLEPKTERKVSWGVNQTIEIVREESCLEEEVSCIMSPNNNNIDDDEDDEVRPAKQNALLTFLVYLLNSCQDQKRGRSYQKVVHHQEQFLSSSPSVKPSLSSQDLLLTVSSSTTSLTMTDDRFLFASLGCLFLLASGLPLFFNIVLSHSN